MPVIAAIQGACIGGGVDMICAADMRFCTANAFFNIKETELGITADVGTLQRIQHVMPSGLARELAYSSRNLGADEALTSGFVNKVYADQDEMLKAVRALASDIAKHSPLAVHGTKEMLNLQPRSFGAGQPQPYGDLAIRHAAGHRYTGSHEGQQRKARPQIR